MTRSALPMAIRGLRRWFAEVLQGWVLVVKPEDPPLAPLPAPSQPPPSAWTASSQPNRAKGSTGVLVSDQSYGTGLGGSDAAGASAGFPALREPLTMEQAVLQRDMSLLKREATDALAALGAAHAMVTSSRLAQIQGLRHQVRVGQLPDQALIALVTDYQGWQNDQVRLFDALAMVLRMRVPEGSTLEQVDPVLRDQARAHLEALSVEYQRGLLMQQFDGQNGVDDEPDGNDGLEGDGPRNPDGTEAED
ncbi:MAG: hypothetical protein ACK6BU_01330 [Cyanobacteriota bacterium]